MNTICPCAASPTRSVPVRRLWVARVTMALLTLITLTPVAHAGVPVDLANQKIFGRWTGNPVGAAPANYSMGSDPDGSDLSPKWLVLGAPNSDDRGVVDEGAIQVFDAVTGKWMRKILPPVGTGTQAYFGAAVAISGDVVAVGAKGADGARGRVFVYNLANGALIKTLSATDSAANDNLGFKVAIIGNQVYASAPYQNANRGAVYVFNLTTGLQSAKLTASDGGGNDFFGYGLAVEGNLLAAGAIFEDASRGAVYLYDLTTMTEVRKFQPAASVAGDSVGSPLSLHQGRLVVGSATSGKAFYLNIPLDTELQLTVSGSGTTYGTSVSINGPLIAVGEQGAFTGIGSVHLFRAVDGAHLRTLNPPNFELVPVRFGTHVTLNGATLLATAYDDNTQGTKAGAAYLFRPLTEELPYARVAAKGNFAPGAVDISYNLFGDAIVSPGARVGFTCSLSGEGSNKSKDIGAFGSMADAVVQELVFKTRDTFAGLVKYGSPTRLSMNDKTTMIGFSPLTGPGTNATNNQVLWCKTDTALSTLMRTGTPFATTPLAGTAPSVLVEAVTSINEDARQVAALCQLKAGVGGANATNDSALYAARVGTSEEVVREGADAPAPLGAETDLGQFAPRVAEYYNTKVYSTALTGVGIAPVTNAAVFTKVYGSNAVLVAEKGDAAVDGAGAFLPVTLYSAFLGEGANGDNGALYRATLLGGVPAVTAATNEGLWMLRSDGVRRLAFRKGQTLAVAGGAKIAKIVQYWYSGNSDTTCEVFALLQLSGTGVSAANDMALVLYQADFSYNLLMREGDAAPGCNGARIGVISRVDVDAWYQGYAMIVTLTGATPLTDQALYCGTLWTGNSTTSAIQRRPYLRLRKGQLFDNQPGKIKSLSLPVGSMTPAGAGGTGRGRSIAWNGWFSFVVEFENGIRQVMRGGLF